MVDEVQQKAHNTILTISNNAMHAANDTVVRHFYTKHKTLTTLQINDQCPLQTIYRGMHVKITGNRNKVLGVVNGQESTVHTIEWNMVLVALPDKRVVSLYPVTNTKEGGTTCMVLPFVTAYALTTCKAQGQTLAALMLCFCSDTIPQGTVYVA